MIGLPDVKSWTKKPTAGESVFLSWREELARIQSIKNDGGADEHIASVEEVGI